MGDDDTQGLSREKILKELKDLIAQIDMEGLLFLMKQANILIYNRNVEALNERVSSLEATKTNRSRLEEVEGVEIEEKPGGENFIVSVQGTRLFFTREELRRMVRICHASEDELDAAARLYAYFSRERSDVLIDCRITAHSHPYLKGVYRKLIGTYKVRE